MTENAKMMYKMLANKLINHKRILIDNVFDILYYAQQERLPYFEMRECINVIDQFMHYIKLANKSMA